MPISHKYKLIFIHIPKCAGISMWHALDLTASKSNLISDSPPVLQHLLPKQLQQKYIDKKTWNSYKKLTIIRNPYERVISDYFWLKEHAPYLITGTFDDFLDMREDVVLKNKYKLDMYYDHFYPMYYYFEGIKYDHVIRYENLAKEYKKIRKIYNIKNDLAKSNETKKNGFVLNKEQQERIYKLYKKDFVLFKFNKKYKSPEPQNTKLKTDTSEIEKSPIVQAEQTDSTVQSPIQAYDDTLIQIFWANDISEFSEENSQNKFIKLNNTSQNISFQISSPDNDINCLRFDLGDREGLLNINNLIIQSKEGQIIWDWNSGKINYKNNIIFIEGNNISQGKTIHLSLNNDPSFIIKLPEVLKSINLQELTITLSLSNLEEAEIKLLSESINVSLSDSILKDLENAKREITNKTEEKNLLDESIQFLNGIIAKLEKENTLVQANCDSKDKTMEGLVKDKEVLSSELSAKTSVFNNLFSEKEKLLKNQEISTTKITELEISTRELSKIKTQLEKDLSTQKEKKSSLTTQKDTLYNKNKELESKINELDKFKIQLEKDIAHLQEKYSAITAEKGILFNKSNEYWNKINELNKIKIQLEKDIVHQQEKYSTVTAEKDVLFNKNNENRNKINELNKIKTQLEQDIVHQQEKYSTITAEKYTLLNKGIESQNKINELNKIKTQLEKDIVHQQEKYSTINAKKEILENKNAVLENKNNELHKIKIQLEKDIAHQQEKHLNTTAEKNILLDKKIQQEKKYNEIIEQKQSLASTANKQQDFIQSLNKEMQKLLQQKDELLSLLASHKEDITRLESVNNEMAQKNKILDATVNDLKEKITGFMEQYENKNILQLISDRIAGKKIS